MPALPEPLPHVDADASLEQLTEWTAAANTQLCELQKAVLSNK